MNGIQFFDFDSETHTQIIGISGEGDNTDPGVYFRSNANNKLAFAVVPDGPNLHFLHRS